MTLPGWGRKVLLLAIIKVPRRRQEEAVKQKEGRDARERIIENRSTTERRRGETVSPDRGQTEQLKDAANRKKRLNRWRY